MQDYTVQFWIDLTEAVEGSVNDYVRLRWSAHSPLQGSSCVTFYINARKGIRVR